MSNPPILGKLLFPQLHGVWGEVNLNDIAIDLTRLLGVKESDANPFLDPHYCDLWKEFLHKMMRVDYSWGGYMEDRSTLWRGHYHFPGRFTHLGIDFYVPLGTAVHLPTRATLVESVIDNDRHGGWGGKVVFKVGDWYFLLAHLKDLADGVGKEYSASAVVGSVAEPERNGGWSPHLHVQCMRKHELTVDGYAANYDGIERDFPDPTSMNWFSSAK